MDLKHQLKVANGFQKGNAAKYTLNTESYFKFEITGLYCFSDSGNNSEESLEVRENQTPECSNINQVVSPTTNVHSGFPNVGLKVGHKANRFVFFFCPWSLYNTSFLIFYHEKPHE